MFVQCLITVTFFLGKIGFIQNEQVRGKILSSNEYNLLVDFSEDAKKKSLYGDYSKVLVNKNKCVKE